MILLLLDLLYLEPDTVPTLRLLTPDPAGDLGENRFDLADTGRGGGEETE